VCEITVISIISITPEARVEGRESARIARETRSDPRAEITFVRAFSKKRNSHPHIRIET